MTVGARLEMPASIAPVKRGGFSACPARSTLEARISIQVTSKAVNMTDANSILNCWKFEVCILYFNRRAQEQRILTDGRKSLLLLSLHGAMQLSGEVT